MQWDLRHEGEADPLLLLPGPLYQRVFPKAKALVGTVRNFTDIRYKIDVFDFSRGDNTILGVWGDPRTYGLTLSYAW